MKQDYEIEALISTFAEHAKINEEHQKFVNRSFLEQYPDKELPPHMENYFNAAQAFLSMCEEIQKLKDQLRGHMRNEHPYA
jgi:hypothetical protein